MTTWLRCHRWWAYSRHFEEKERPWIKLGNQVHGYLKAWLLYGAPPPDNKAGKVSRAALHLIPAPQRLGMQVEGVMVGQVEPPPLLEYDDQADHPSRFQFLYEGVTYTGQKDYRLPGVVGDHKTCRTFNYVPTAKAILGHPQPCLYLRHEAELCDNPVLKGRWGYYSTGQVGRTVAVDFSETRENVKSRFHRLHLAVGSKIATCSDDPAEHERNFSSCGKMGGCPHKAVCYVGVSLKERIDHLMRGFMDDTPSAAQGSTAPRRRGPTAAAQPEPEPDPTAEYADGDDGGEAFEQGPPEPPPPERPRRGRPPKGAAPAAAAPATRTREATAGPTTYPARTVEDYRRLNGDQVVRLVEALLTHQAADSDEEVVSLILAIENR
jgi:hypothetical protein